MTKFEIKLLTDLGYEIEEWNDSKDHSFINKEKSIRLRTYRLEEMPDAFGKRRAPVIRIFLTHASIGFQAVATGGFTVGRPSTETDSFSNDVEKEIMEVTRQCKETKEEYERIKKCIESMEGPWEEN